MAGAGRMFRCQANIIRQCSLWPDGETMWGRTLSTRDFLRSCAKALALIGAKAFAHRVRSYSGRSGRRRGAGKVSGDTAPPEMMKAIAWSMVQSVGVSSSIGTSSR